MTHPCRHPHRRGRARRGRAARDRAPRREPDRRASANPARGPRQRHHARARRAARGWVRRSWRAPARGRVRAAAALRRRQTGVRRRQPRSDAAGAAELPGRPDRARGRRAQARRARALGRGGRPRSSSSASAPSTPTCARSTARSACARARPQVGSPRRTACSEQRLAAAYRPRQFGSARPPDSDLGETARCGDGRERRPDSEPERTRTGGTPGPARRARPTRRRWREEVTSTYPTPFPGSEPNDASSWTVLQPNERSARAAAAPDMRANSISRGYRRASGGHKRNRGRAAVAAVVADWGRGRRSAGSRFGRRVGESLERWSAATGRDGRTEPRRRPHSRRRLSA